MKTKYFAAFTLPALAFFLSFADVKAQSFTANFNQSQDFTQGVGSTGWTGAYGGNNSSSTFASGSGQLTINDAGGYWEGGFNSGHLLYISVTGDFTATAQLKNLSSANYASAGLGAFDPSLTTASPTVTWIGTYYKGFDTEVGTRPTINGSTQDHSPASLVNSGNLSLTFQMTRVGDVFTQSYSLNGTTFTELDSYTMSTLPQTVDVGLWDASFSGSTSTAVFTSFSVEAVPEPATVSLVGAGILAWLAVRRRK